MAAAASSSAPEDLWIESGRGYGNYHRGQYLFPVDAKEQERLDIMHTMILSARPRPHRLHRAPFVPRPDPVTGDPPRVLDLGYGTAIWMLDMAQKYGTNTEIVGLDLADMAPQDLFPHVNTMHHIDFESPWAMGEQSYDFIHLQMGLGSVGNWPLLYDRIHRHLKPGAWFEHVEIDWEPRCADGTLNPQGMLMKWWNEYVGPPFGVVGRPIIYNPGTGELLNQRGFTNINHEEYRIPTNGWSDNRAEHVAGTWWENAMASGNGRGHGMEAMSLAVLTRVQRWSAEHAKQLCADAMTEAGNPATHAFTVLHVWWAQKPPLLPR